MPLSIFLPTVCKRNNSTQVGKTVDLFNERDNNNNNISHMNSCPGHEPDHGLNSQLTPKPTPTEPSSRNAPRRRNHPDLRLDIGSTPEHGPILTPYPNPTDSGSATWGNKHPEPSPKPDPGSVDWDNNNDDYNYKNINPHPEPWSDSDPGFQLTLEVEPISAKPQFHPAPWRGKNPELGSKIGSESYIGLTPHPQPTPDSNFLPATWGNKHPSWSPSFLYETHLGVLLFFNIPSDAPLEPTF
jgi:hypothetical protein